ncbi:amino acid adenylation domain-containing protein [Alkalinema pantanalense CENA528]|uniref:amino acid adenylation domain-containing protein n=1 Tax=Alkalinema pantanalense TaxID=1620705 RepID=UPI003D6F4798
MKMNDIAKNNLANGQLVNTPISNDASENSAIENQNTNRDFAKRIAALTPEQQALLQQRLKQKSDQKRDLLTDLTTNKPANSQANTTANIWKIQHYDRAQIGQQDTFGRWLLPVSFAQQRMWFQDQLGLQSAVSNNITIALHITGDLQFAALEDSLKTILQRHEVLRTTVQMVNGELYQTVEGIEDWRLTVLDWTALEPETQRSNVQQYSLEQACQPFNLATDRTLRSTLLQLSTREFMLLLTFHHIAVDAWSIGVFFRELSALYAAFSQGQPSPLLPLPVQYKDFTIWQRQFFQNHGFDADLAYWKKNLDQATDRLTLPSDRTRPESQSFVGKTLSFNLSKSIADGLKRLGQQTETTLFMTLLATLQTLLFRYTGQEDILIGSPIANRQQPEVEPLIGCFINTLVLRTDLSGHPSFRTLLQRVRETVLGALAHQTLPFEKLVDELQLSRSLAYAPLFQVMLVLQNTFAIETIELPGVTVQHERIDNHTAQFDLTFHLVESDHGLIGKLEYNTDLFDKATIVRLLDQFQTLLTGIVADPDQAIDHLPLLTSQDQQQLLQWHLLTISQPSQDCIHHWLEQQVEKTPNAIAVQWGTEQLTYAEINQKANQLARYLQTLGIQSESRVGLWVDRSGLMIVTLLGILKAGGAYVPLDPQIPTQRLAWIVSDAQVAVLLTQAHLTARLPQDFPTTQIVDLDAAWPRIAAARSENLAIPVQPNALAYVIYTSGSTGTPKGVMVEHRSLVSYTASAIENYQISAHDRCLQFASLSFDAAAEEIYPTLVQGATLVLRTEAMLSSMAQFLQTCWDWRITVLNLPTAFWHQLVTEMVTPLNSVPSDLVTPQATLNRSLADSLADSLRLVIIGGEKALVDRWMLWQQQVPAQVRLVNSYGPTEATIVTTTADLTGLNPADWVGRELPIGRPVRHASTYVLDPALQPVPIGVPGELYIGGAGVARGYLNRPALTAQAFIPNPFSSTPDARLYKTGDRVRYWPDGNLEFLGRIDNQVKVRGFRIELDEIAAVFNQHPVVQEAVILDRRDASGDIRLIAYWVPRNIDSAKSVGFDRAAISSRDFRQFLEKRLPKYMIPAAFVPLDRLPLNTSGKLDRQRLPEPVFDRIDRGETLVAPRTDLEVTIAQAFAQVLPLEQDHDKPVNIHDDFFELGGHSLLATKLLARLIPVLGVKLSIVDLFEFPTVAGLAQRVTTLQQAQKPLVENAIDHSRENNPAIPLTHPTRPPFRTIDESAQSEIVLSFFQESIWELHHSGSNGAAWNSSITLRFRGDLTRDTIAKSVNELIRRHAILRTVFPAIAGQPRQVILPELEFTVQDFDLQTLPLADLETTALNHAIELSEQPFDLATAPLWRVARFQLAPTEHWLLITLHHIITDGWSFGILLQELQTLIAAFSQGRPSPLPPVEWQYAAFAQWQRQVYSEATIAQELQHWEQKWRNREATIAPPSFPSQPPRSRRSRHAFTQLPEPLTAAVTALSQQLKVTRFGLLLAVLKLALAAWTGQQELWIFLTVGNRTLPETERMIGCFINDVIVRSQLLPTLPGSVWVQQLQTEVNDAIAHQDLPIGWVMEQMQSRLPSVVPAVLMASVTHTTAVQESVNANPSAWEVIDMQTKQREWAEIESELSSDETPLEIYIETAQTLSITVNYSVELFTPTGMAELFEHYQRILRHLIAEPQTPLMQIVQGTV